MCVRVDDAMRVFWLAYACVFFNVCVCQMGMEKNQAHFDTPTVFPVTTGMLSGAPISHRLSSQLQRLSEIRVYFSNLCFALPGNAIGGTHARLAAHVHTCFLRPLYTTTHTRALAHALTLLQR